MPKHSRFYFLVLLVALTSTLTTYSFAGQEKVLHLFNGTPVTTPSSGLISDPAGNLFGVTQGAVYELSPASSGGFTYHVIATLPGGRFDGGGGNLVRDTAGNLYGATAQGGLHGGGYVYKLSPNTGGAWTLSVIHIFDGRDGGEADHTMVLDASGNLYGVGSVGGPAGEGVVFELSPGTGASWTYTVLHDFTNDEGLPLTGLVMDAAGKLYGGTLTQIFKMTPGTGGTWTESTALVLNDSLGFYPKGDLTFDSAGNLYGTTSSGGAFGTGTAFKLSPTSGGGWDATVLHAFGSTPEDGLVPYSGLTLDNAGNLYGATTVGGTNNAGIVFKLSFVNGTWQESILYTFTGNSGHDGANPIGSLYVRSNTLYGATAGGGSSACMQGLGCGTVFAIR